MNPFMALLLCNRLSVKLAWVLFVVLSALHAGATTENVKARNVACDGKIIPYPRLLRLTAPTPQAVVESIIVNAGTRVRETQTLATLHGYSTIMAELKLAEAEAEFAENELALAIEELHSNIAEAEDRVSILKQKLVFAKEAFERKRISDAQVQMLIDSHEVANMRLQNAEKIQPLIKAEIEAEVKAVRAELDAVTRDRERPVVEERLNVATASSARKLAELDVLLDERKQEITHTKNQLKQGQYLFYSLTEVSMGELKAAEAEIGIALRSIERLKNKYQILVQKQPLQKTQNDRHQQLLFAKAENFIIRAPMDGDIFAVNTQPGEVIGEIGVFDFGDASRLQVEAEVYIHDIRHVKVGDTAILTGDGFAGEVAGTVTEIAAQSHPSNVFSPDVSAFMDKRVVSIWIQPENPPELFKRLINSQVIVRLSPRQ